MKNFSVHIFGSGKANGQGRNGFNAGEASVGRVAVLEGGDDGGVGLDGVGDARSLSRCQLREFGRRRITVALT